ncbi:MAG: diversity-generating retroelement protein Avd [Geobacter sp.]
MQDLVIYQRMYDFMLYLFPIVDRFPKHEKFALCVNIKNCCIETARLIVRANKARNKRPLLFDIDVALEELRLLLRFSRDRRHLSNKSYECSARQIGEVGRLLGGWLKSTG